MSHFALVGVTLLSVLSIALHIIHLNDYKPDDPTSIVAVASTGALFILPWAKSYIPYVGEWLFILASLTSLISQAISFGQLPTLRNATTSRKRGGCGLMY